MKFSVKLLSCIIIMFCISFVFSACGTKNDNTNEETSNISSDLSIIQDVFETEYRIGESLKIASLPLVANQSTTRVPSATYINNGKKETLFSDEEFLIEGFDSSTSGNKKLKISYGEYKGYIDYKIKNETIKDVLVVNNQEYLIGEIVNKLTLKVIYSDNYCVLRQYELKNNEIIDTSSTGNKSLYFKPDYCADELKFDYSVYSVSEMSCELDFITEFPLGFYYNFEEDGATFDINFKTNEGKTITKRVALSGEIVCDVVGEHTIYLVYGNNSISYTYSVYAITDLTILDNQRTWFSVDSPPTILYLKALMSNGYTFDRLKVDISDIDVSVVGNFNKVINFQGFNLVFEYEIVSISSINTDNLSWESVYYLDEGFRAQTNQITNTSNNMEEVEEVQEIFFSYLNKMSGFDYSVLNFNGDIPVETDDEVVPENFSSVYDNYIYWENYYNSVSSISTHYESILSIVGLNVLSLSTIYNIKLHFSVLSSINNYFVIDNINALNDEYFVPINIVYSNGESRIEDIKIKNNNNVFGSEDGNFTISGFNTNTVGSKSLNISYYNTSTTFNYNTSTTFNYDVKQIQSVEVNTNTFYSGINYDDANIGVKITSNDNSVNYFSVPSTTIFENNKRVVGLIMCGEEYYLYSINKIAIKNITTEVQNYWQYENVDVVEINVEYEDNTIQTNYVYTVIDTSVVGKHEIELVYGGTRFIYNYEVVKVVSYEIDDLYKSLTVGRTVSNVTIKFVLTNEEVILVNHHLNNPIYATTSGNFKIDLQVLVKRENEYVFYNNNCNQTNITYSYTVTGTNINSISVSFDEEKHKVLLGESRSNYIDVNLLDSENNIIGVNLVLVELNTESIGIKQATINYLGFSCILNYQVVPISRIEMSESCTKLYYIGQKMNTLSFYVCGGDLRKYCSIYDNNNNPNISITGFDTSSIGLKKMTINYYGLSFEFNYYVGKIKSIGIINNNQLLELNSSSSINLDFKVVLTNDYELGETVGDNLCSTDIATIFNSYIYNLDTFSLGNKQKTIKCNGFELVFYYSVCQTTSVEVIGFNTNEFYENKNNSVEIEYKIIYSNGCEIIKSKTINYLEKSKGNFKQIIELEQGFNYTFEYEVIGIKSCSILLVDSDFEVNTDQANVKYYVIKDSIIDHIYLSVVYENNKSFGTTIFTNNIPTNELGEKSISLISYGYDINFYYTVCEIKNVVAECFNTEYIIVGVEQKIKLNVTVTLNDNAIAYSTAYADIFVTSNVEQSVLFEFKGSYYTFTFTPNVVTKIEVINFKKVIKNVDTKLYYQLLYTLNNDENFLVYRIENNVFRKYYSYKANSVGDYYNSVDINTSNNDDTYSVDITELGVSTTIEYNVVEISSMELYNNSLKLNFKIGDKFEINSKVYCKDDPNYVWNDLLCIFEKKNGSLLLNDYALVIDDFSYNDAYYLNKSRFIVTYSDGTSEIINFPKSSNKEFSAYWQGSNNAGEFVIKIIYNKFELQLNYTVTNN